MTIALWIVAVTLIVVGVIGTVLPALPGAILVFAGVALGAWIDDFTRISGWTPLVLGILTLLAWVIDYVAALAGAKRAGASRQALIGAAAVRARFDTDAGPRTVEWSTAPFMHGSSFGSGMRPTFGAPFTTPCPARQARDRPFPPSYEFSGK